MSASSIKDPRQMADIVDACIAAGDVSGLREGLNRLDAMVFGGDYGAKFTGLGYWGVDRFLRSATKHAKPQCFDAVMTSGFMSGFLASGHVKPFKIVLNCICDHSLMGVRLDDQRLLELTEVVMSRMENGYGEDVGAHSFVARNASLSFFGLYAKNLTDKDIANSSGDVLSSLLQRGFSDIDAGLFQDLFDAGFVVHPSKETEAFASLFGVYPWQMRSQEGECLAKNRSEILEVFLRRAPENGFDVFEVSRRGYTAAYEAIGIGDVAFIKRLAKLGVPCFSAQKPSWFKSKSALNEVAMASYSVYLGYLDHYGHQDILSKEKSACAPHRGVFPGGVDSWPRMIAAAYLGSDVAIRDFAAMGDYPGVVATIPKQKHPVGVLECAVLSKSKQAVFAAMDLGLDVHAKSASGRPILSRTRSKELLEAARARSATQAITGAMDEVQAPSSTRRASSLSPF